MNLTFNKGKNADLPSSNLKEGSFYLTTDNHELWFANSSNTKFKISDSNLALKSHKHNWSDINNPPNFALSNHNHDDKYCKRVQITNIQTTSYRHSLIALCNTSAVNSSGGTYSHGTITFHRVNGLFGTDAILEIMISDAYSLDHGINYNIKEISGAGHIVAVPCTFQHNGIIYGGLDIYIQSAESFDVNFYGISNFNIFGFDYKSGSTDILDQEANDSLNYENVYSAGYTMYFNQATILTSSNYKSFLADASVNYANSAGSAASANAVDWSNISNKPSSFKPSSHTHTLFNNALSFNIKISEHSSPGDQPLFINCAEPSVDVTLKNAPGIGFHVANKGQANFIFMPEDNSFRFVNSSLTSYVPIYASTIHGTLIGNVDWSNITNKANSYYPASQCIDYTSDDRGTTPAAVKKAFTIFEPKAHAHSQYVTWNHNANGLNVSMIQYRDSPVDGWGHGIGIGGGGLSVLGGGESATVVLDNRSPSEETAIVASDGAVEILTNLQANYAGRQTFRFNTAGNFFSPNGIFPSTKDVGDLGNFNFRWKRLWTKEVIISGAASTSLGYNSNAPRITFMEENGIQPVQILYTDADAYRAPAGLKICGGPDASPSWLEVKGDLYASHLRADYLRGAIMLSNKEWTSYGTATPDSSYTAKEGRLYFKII